MLEQDLAFISQEGISLPCEADEEMLVLAQIQPRSVCGTLQDSERGRGGRLILPLRLPVVVYCGVFQRRLETIPAAGRVKYPHTDWAWAANRCSGYDS